MATISLLEARKTFSTIIGRAAYGHQRYILERHGEPMAAIVSIEDLRYLEQLEEQEDLAAAREALASDEGTITMEEMKAKYGVR